jgi:bacteriorhodopsin
MYKLSGYVCNQTKEKKMIVINTFGSLYLYLVISIALLVLLFLVTDNKNIKPWKTFYYNIILIGLIFTSLFFATIETTVVRIDPADLKINTITNIVANPTIVLKVNTCLILRF